RQDRPRALAAAPVDRPRARGAPWQSGARDRQGALRRREGRAPREPVRIARRQRARGAHAARAPAGLAQKSRVKRHVVLLLGPSREAISGVTTHLNSLLGSRLSNRFDLLHFQVGSEGRREGPIGFLARLVLSPMALALAIARHGVDVVHINTSLNAKAYWRDLAYVAVAKLCGARVLYQVHGGQWEQFAPKGGLFAALMRRMLRWPDALVVLSREQLDAFRAAAPDQAVELVPNGIDCAPYLRYNRAAAEAASPLRLIYIGRLVAGKGLLETLEGLRIARANGVQARLVIAGNGPEEPRLRQYAREAGLARDVSFV